MKVEIELNCGPVSWSNGKPLKYRAMASVTIDNEVRNVYGNPKHSTREAWEDLRRECNLMDIATRRIRAEIPEAINTSTQ